MKHRLLLAFPPEERFEVSEGTHRAVTRKVIFFNQKYKDSSEKTVRIKWHLPLLDAPGVEYVVAKNYPLSLEPHSELRKHLTSWLGHVGLRNLLVNGDIDLLLLEGMEADIVTQHGPDRGFKHPFVNVVDVVPAGTYTNPDNMKAASCLKHLRKFND